MGLYIHIPFCRKKCLYCDFPSFAGQESLYEDYVNALTAQIREWSAQYGEQKISSIFIGGGTPTVLPPLLLGRIMDGIFRHFDIRNEAEITIEANPGTVDGAYFRELKAMALNRLSFGLQAWQDDLLRTLGRIHTRELFVRNFHEAREAGFKNINCDLMFSLPNQTLIQWEETLEKVMKLNPEHISAYSLIVEEGTPFYELYEKKVYAPVDEVLDRSMYALAKEMLGDKGYQQYEISNFAREGRQSRHNILYWQTEPYLGLGLGAHSYINNVRFHSTYELREYIEAKGNRKKLVQEEEILSLEDRMAEFMFMGLRMTAGISLNKFQERFNTDFISVYGAEAEYLLENNLVALKKDHIYLTDKGIDISNFVFEKFLKNQQKN